MDDFVDDAKDFGESVYHAAEGGIVAFREWIEAIGDDAVDLYNDVTDPDWWASLASDTWDFAVAVATDPDVLLAALGAAFACLGGGAATAGTAGGAAPVAIGGCAASLAALERKVAAKAIAEARARMLRALCGRSNRDACAALQAFDRALSEHPNDTLALIAQGADQAGGHGWGWLQSQITGGMRSLLGDATSRARAAQALGAQLLRDPAIGTLAAALRVPPTWPALQHAADALLQPLILGTAQELDAMVTQVRADLLEQLRAQLGEQIGHHCPGPLAACLAAGGPDAAAAALQRAIGSGVSFIQTHAQQFGWKPDGTPTPRVDVVGLSISEALTPACQALHQSAENLVMQGLVLPMLRGDDAAEGLPRIAQGLEALMHAQGTLTDVDNDDVWGTTATNAAIDAASPTATPDLNRQMMWTFWHASYQNTLGAKALALFQRVHADPGTGQSRVLAFERRLASGEPPERSLQWAMGQLGDTASGETLLQNLANAVNLARQILQQNNRPTGDDLVGTFVRFAKFDARTGQFGDIPAGLAAVDDQIRKGRPIARQAGQDPDNIDPVNAAAGAFAGAVAGYFGGRMAGRGRRTRAVGAGVGGILGGLLGNKFRPLHWSP